MSAPRITPQPQVPVSQQQPDGPAAAARKGSFSSKDVAIVKSGQQPEASARPADTAGWKQGGAAAASTLQSGELDSALTGARKSRSIGSLLRSMVRAIIRMFTGAPAGAPASGSLERVASQARDSGNLQAFANSQLLAQLDAANRSAGASISKLDQPVSAQAMAGMVTSDPSILRQHTAPAASLHNLLAAGAAEGIVSTHRLPPAEAAERVADFQAAAGLLASVYDARFRPDDANTAFARFGAEKNNPYQQLAAGYVLSMDADEDLRDWLQTAITYSDRAAVALLESAEGIRTQINLEQLGLEVERFTAASAHRL